MLKNSQDIIEIDENDLAFLIAKYMFNRSEVVLPGRNRVYFGLISQVIDELFGSDTYVEEIRLGIVRRLLKLNNIHGYRQEGNSNWEGWEFRSEDCISNWKLPTYNEEHPEFKRKPVEPVSPVSYSCGRCGKKFGTNKYDFNQHRQGKINCRDEYACPICLDDLVGREALRIHVEKTHYDDIRQQILSFLKQKNDGLTSFNIEQGLNFNFSVQNFLKDMEEKNSIFSIDRDNSTLWMATPESYPITMDIFDKVVSTVSSQSEVTPIDIEFIEQEIQEMAVDFLKTQYTSEYDEILEKIYSHLRSNLNKFEVN